MGWGGVVGFMEAMGVAVVVAMEVAEGVVMVVMMVAEVEEGGVVVEFEAKAERSNATQ
jgi:hypothetical protein